MIEVEFEVTMKCKAHCDDLVEAHLDEAKMAVKKGLIRDMKKLYGVKVQEITVEARKVK